MFKSRDYAHGDYAYGAICTAAFGRCWRADSRLVLRGSNLVPILEVFGDPVGYWFQSLRLVERSPEKAGGGSTPSLATMFSSTYLRAQLQFCSNLFLKN